MDEQQKSNATDILYELRKTTESSLLSGGIFVLVMIKTATVLGASPEELLPVTTRSGPDQTTSSGMYQTQIKAGSAPWSEIILDQVIPAHLYIEFVFQITHWEGE